MCGFAGLYDPARRHPAAALRSIVGGMGDRLVHRGPDDRGEWADAAAGIGLSHRRLAIVDLSASGHQPMPSSDGKHVLVYNGEIYNHQELRRQLSSQGITFRGHSDTETLIEAIAAWGLRETLTKTNGMFALAVWDAAAHRLRLARDRLGIKPLYYGWVDQQFVFGSELKALTAHPGFRAEINRDAICTLLQHSYIPGPISIYEGIYKLPPGTCASIRTYDKPGPLATTEYWSVREVAERGDANPFRGTREAALGELDNLVTDAVRLRQMADVPLGAFLSGGVDSSTVVALAQRELARPLQTFSIGFDEPKYNEADFARRVAEHLKTDHHELYVTADQAREVIPRLPSLYDEPFADSSQIPTFLVAQFARQHVTVALSGDGGDELFGGYTRYALVANLWKRLRWLPRSSRRALAPLLRTAGRVPGRRGRQCRTLAAMVTAADGRHLYRHAHTHWKHPAEIVVGGQVPATIFDRCDDWTARDNLLEELMAIDFVTYLPDDILAKVDRASMGVGLEARVPLLDHRVVEFAWSLPLNYKVHGGEPKWLLRQILDRCLPRDLLDRPKVGFGVPLDAWLRGPLRGWAEDLLSESRLQQEGFFQVAPIRKRWQEHVAGEQDWHYYLWDVLMFQAWNAARCHEPS